MMLSFILCFIIYQLLFVLDCGKYEHILDWTSNGEVILVKDTEIFSNVVLPALFEKDAKFESFTRKMRRWGFSTKKGQIVPSSDSSKKPNKNRTKYLFQHNEFQRNQPELCANISCRYTSRADALSFDQLSNSTNSFQQQNLQVGIAPANFVQLNNAASFASNSSLAQQNLSTPATSAFMMPFQQQGNIADILNSSQNASMFLSSTSPALPQLQEQQTAALSADRAQSLLLLLQQQQQQNQHNAMPLQNLGILQQQRGILDNSRLLLPQANQDLTTMGRANLNLLKDEGHNGSQLSGRLPKNDSNMTAINLLQSFPNIGVNNSTSADLHRILPVSSNPYARQEPSNFLRAASGLGGSDNAFLSRPGGSAISPFGMSTHHANLLDSGFSQIQPSMGQTQVQQNHYFVSRLPQNHQQEQIPNEASLRKRTRNEVDVPAEEQERKNSKTSCDRGESSTPNISSV